MENREVEEILKQNYNSIKKQSFDQRFSRISGRLNMPQGQPQEVFVPESQPALAGAGGVTNVEHSPRRTKLAVIISLALFTVIALTCVFMWIYTPSNNIGYSVDVADLIYDEVSKDDFENTFKNNEFEILHTDSIGNFIYSYIITLDNRNNLSGGWLWFENSNDGYFGDIEFYTLNVTGISTVSEPYQTYTTTSGTDVNYTVSGGGEADPLYNTVASATYKNMNYYIEYTSLNNDALGFFNAIFA